jgi:hypothetical protein
MLEVNGMAAIPFLGVRAGRFARFASPHICAGLSAFAAGFESACARHKESLLWDTINSAQGKPDEV